MLANELLLIDGKLVPAASGKVFETVNPATEEVLGTVADAGAEDLEALFLQNARGQVKGAGS
jgi:aldehyde dehydrogenase (NAD+)